MELIITQKNLTKEQEEKFGEYVNKKVPAMEQFFGTFSKDSVLLNVKIEKFEKHDAFEVEMSLSIPNKKFYSKETSHHITKAVDLSKDRLSSQIKKYLEQSREQKGATTIRKQ